ncbi:MAG: Na+/H+ antiporter NhaC family protein [Woeseia sp.]|nr:Na+/H+ antiporter NhaC family protein [Woeseia sp.]MBT7253665.1 Na+/H+ antiporter NhaC family protein [Planctomycetaceae bacterium]
MTLLTVLPVFAADVVMEAPDILLTGVGFDVNVAGLDPQSTAELRLNGEVIATSSDGSIAVFDIVLSDTGTANFDVTQGGHSVVAQALTIIPGWVSLSPPVIAILLAFLLRSVIPALFVGLFVGAWAVNGMTWAGVVSGFFETVSIYIVNTSIDHDHMTIIAFTFLIGGMIGIISKNGGMNGIVNAIMPFASSPRRGQGVIATLGLAIFFDDYSNTMIVGNATRPMSDKLRISREKLAYLVDSTAAPVATVAIITTWIGFQVGLIDSAIEGLEGITATPYVLFLNSIAYSFYPFLALFFVFLIVYTGKDFGPMYHAEIRARKNGEVLKAPLDGAVAKPNDDFEHKDGVPCRALNAILPIATMILTVVVGLYISGEGETITDIIGSANSYVVLIWASLLGCLVAAIVTLSQRILSLDETVEAWLVGAKFMLTGLVLLVMAWAVADVATVLQTAPYLISVLGDSLSPETLPAIIFMLAACTAFATGSSWGVMAILMPLVIPLCWAVLQSHGIADAEHMHILYSSIACVLTGAVWADHCSPISDTTVLSSLATGCDHMDHVRTQLPYALLGGVAAVLIGILPAGFGLPWFLLLPTAAVVLVVVHRFLAKPTD